MPKNRVELTGAEWPVMKVIWEIEPCTAPAVREILAESTGWTYSTVRTLMDRMAAKGVLNAKKEGKLTIYSSAVTRREAQRGELFYTLKHAFNGAFAPLVQLHPAVAEVIPVASRRWRGALHRATTWQEIRAFRRTLRARGDEVVMIIKTRATLAEAVRLAVKEMHSYTTPAVLVIPLDSVDPDYQAWIMRETASES